MQKPSEYYQQEIELQKIINDNLLAEIQRLKNGIDDDLSRSFNSEASSPTPSPKEIKQRSQENNNTTNIQTTDDDNNATAPNVTEVSDLKNEMASIKNKILQIELETRDILKNSGLISEEKNESLVNYVNSIEQSFRRIYSVGGESDSSNHHHQVVKTEDTNDQSEQFLKLQEKFNEMELDFKGVEQQLVDSENTVNKLNAEFKDVSLQVKIVSLFFNKEKLQSKAKLNCMELGMGLGYDFRIWQSAAKNWFCRCPIPDLPSPNFCPVLVPYNLVLLWTVV